MLRSGRRSRNSGALEVIFDASGLNLEALGWLWTHFGQVGGPLVRIGYQLGCLGGSLGGSWARVGAGWSHFGMPWPSKVRQILMGAYFGTREIVFAVGKSILDSGSGLVGSGTS